MRQSPDPQITTISAPTSIGVSCRKWPTPNVRRGQAMIKQPTPKENPASSFPEAGPLYPNPEGLEDVTNTNRRSDGVVDNGTDRRGRTNRLLETVLETAQSL